MKKSDSLTRMLSSINDAWDSTKKKNKEGRKCVLIVSYNEAEIIDDSANDHFEISGGKSGFMVLERPSEAISLQSAALANFMFTISLLASELDVSREEVAEMLFEGFHSSSRTIPYDEDSTDSASPQAQ